MQILLDWEIRELPSDEEIDWEIAEFPSDKQILYDSDNPDISKQKILQGPHLVYFFH